MVTPSALRYLVVPFRARVVPRAPIESAEAGQLQGRRQTWRIRVTLADGRSLELPLGYERPAPARAAAARIAGPGGRTSRA
jgi:hypothetical protein